MFFKLFRRPVRMRPADPYDADFHLLDELAKPPACVTAGRIAVWVYRDGLSIREVVLSGHAEHGTCSRATTILIESIKDLDGAAKWMLTCGAARFRISDEQAKPGPSPEELLKGLTGPDPFASGLPDPRTLAALLGRAPLSNNQSVLGKMIHDLQELGEQTGLLEIHQRDWQVLSAFREEYCRRMEASSGLLVMPPQAAAAGIADYLPIVPRADPKGKPLVFTLEGWDFDCPDYQLVADLHLRSMCRQLLKDALVRRQTYRGWLKEWMEQWVQRLHGLPESEAGAVRLAVPGPADRAKAPDTPARADSFLRDHAAAFLDRGQEWPRGLLHWHENQRYGMTSAAELDREIHPTTIVEVDFERGLKRERQVTDEDRSFTMRQRISQTDPHMISQCLQYIRRMDAIIRPYEQLRLREGQRDARGEARDDAETRKLQPVRELNAQIVLETMIRGWPSFYLDDEKDRAVFDRWARRYRPRVWSVMARQARRAGVALELLLEDNVVYEVRMDQNLGCTVQPLVLIDDAVHAQVHGSRAGASAVVPLWSRTTRREMTPEVMALGPGNTQRAARLVERAGRHADAANASVKQAADCLRLALACHPAEAGRLILEEWARRLGRDTSGEFAGAHAIVEAGELCARDRYAEAKPHVAEYLSTEPDPVPDAYVMAAMCEMIGPEPAQLELREKITRRNRLVKPHNELLEKTKSRSREGGTSVEDALDALEHRRMVERLKSLHGEIERLEKSIKRLEAETERSLRRRRKLIEMALANPDSVRQVDLAKIDEEVGGPPIEETPEPNELLARHLPPHVLQRLIGATGPLDLGNLDLADLLSRHSVKPGPAGRVKRQPDPRRFPDLARAARKAPEILRGTLERGCRYTPYASGSEVFFRRYAGVRQVVEIRGLFEILESLSRIQHRIEQDPHQARLEAIDEIQRLARANWIPETAADDLKMVAEEFAKGDWDRLQANQICAVLREAGDSCGTSIRNHMNDPMVIHCPLAEAQITRICITYLAGNYRNMLEMLFSARVVLGRAVCRPWSVLDETTRDWPADGSLSFDGRTGTIWLNAGGRRTGLLRAENLSAEETAYVGTLIADPALPHRISPIPRSLAEKLLGAEVEPSPRWCVWRDAMRAVRRELLVAIAYYGYRANFRPIHESQLTPRTRDIERRMDQVPPRLDPSIDWNWSDPGAWRSLIGKKPVREYGKVH